jgi:hypothetical protein
MGGNKPPVNAWRLVRAPNRGSGAGTVMNSGDPGVLDPRMGAENESKRT